MLFSSDRLAKPKQTNKQKFKTSCDSYFWENSNPNFRLELALILKMHFGAFGEMAIWPRYSLYEVPITPGTLVSKYKRKANAETQWLTWRSPTVFFFFKLWISLFFPVLGEVRDWLHSKLKGDSWDFSAVLLLDLKSLSMNDQNIKHHKRTKVRWFRV